ncbi:DUF2125 domain-containing protein [Swingsia samuiensis]|uniref:DUF2125 domain-containing protein n=1 Tax=Swingsia samuiensis TaxID=1293412 RepID=A0A4Y6UIA5_9PROT|nr:DUF2125 domain-containing protein [Swingsia samuiensis]QDH16176.1 DUF2125 domain-containing protein [Swingsia samuiensis]
MMSFKAFLFTMMASASTTLMASAHADTLPSIPASCFTYSFHSHQTGENELKASGMHASLTGTDITLDVGNISLKDPQKSVSENQLEHFNAIAAYAALSAFRGGITPACQGLDATNTLHDIQKGTPEALWANIKLDRPNHTMTLQRVSIKATQTNPLLRLKISGSGIHDSKQPLIPSSLTTDLSVSPKVGSFQTVTINSFHSISGESSIDAQGKVDMGSSAATSKADLHVSINNISAFDDRLHQIAPTKVIAAIAIARMMGHHSGETTSWDIELEGGTVSVNGVPMPISLPH